jgi:hypothetical protein
MSRTIDARIPRTVKVDHDGNILTACKYDGAGADGGAQEYAPDGTLEHDYALTCPGSDPCEGRARLLVRFRGKFDERLRWRDATRLQDVSDVVSMQSAWWNRNRV